MIRVLALAIITVVSIPVHAQKPLGDGIVELATQITTSAAKQEKRRIAVLPFRELDGQPTVLGTYLAEELVTNLFQLGNFKIVERQLLDKVMSELRIQRSGAIDPSTAKEIGRITAVDAIVTGSITELENFIAVNCRLIDTTTGEVFGAAQTKIAKDDDVTKILNSVLGADDQTAGGSTRTSYESAKPIATKQLGSLRVVLKSVLPMKFATRNGQTTNGVRWTLELNNREARKDIVVALNAEAMDDGVVNLNRYPSGMTTLRSSVVDDRGGVWKLSSAGLGSIGFVRAGVHGRNGQDAYSATDITRLLRLRDQLGRDTDDPSDGITANADSMGEGGSNVTFGGGRITSPPRFFPYKGNRFISGSTTTISPGQSVVVTLNFEQQGGVNSSPPTFYQFTSEIVVGVTERGSTSYSLHNLAFDRVLIPPS